MAGGSRGAQQQQANTVASEYRRFFHGDGGAHAAGRVVGRASVAAAGWAAKKPQRSGYRVAGSWAQRCTHITPLRPPPRHRPPRRTAPKRRCPPATPAPPLLHMAVLTPFLSSALAAGHPRASSLPSLQPTCEAGGALAAPIRAPPLSVLRRASQARWNGVATSEAGGVSLLPPERAAGWAAQTPAPAAASTAGRCRRSAAWMARSAAVAATWHPASTHQGGSVSG